MNKKWKKLIFELLPRNKDFGRFFLTGALKNYRSRNWRHSIQQQSRSRLHSPQRSYSKRRREGLDEGLKVALYSFLGAIPPKFEHKLRRHKQTFRKIATTVVLDKDENFLWSGLQRHRSCHSNEMTPLPILLAAVYLGTGNCSSKIVHGSFLLQ